MAAILVSWAASFVVLTALAIGLAALMRPPRVPLGILVDYRGRYSLTHFQLALWSVVILSLISGVFWGRLIDGVSSPLEFTIPAQVLGLLGISVGSAAAATVAKAAKDATVPERIAASGAEDPPRLSQIFMLEEGQYADCVVDLTKYQNFIITIVLVAAYTALSIHAIADAKSAAAFTSLPSFAGNFLILVGISQAGYVAGKVPTQPGIPTGLTMDNRAAPPSDLTPRNPKAADATGGGGAAPLIPLLSRGSAQRSARPAAQAGAVAPARTARATTLRTPNSLPDPAKPAGTVNPNMPFDHIVVVMMENHSFDNLLGELPNLGRNDVEGLSFGPDGMPTNWNPDAHGNPVRAYPFPSTAQESSVTQGWNACHKQINAGRMDGFVASVNGATQPMGYYPKAVLPFAYSLASEFTLATRWFSSAPCPTYPNRRFLLAGTAFGGTTTAPSTLFDSPPPNGTIFDRLDQHGLSWHNYFTDIPMTAVIPDIVENHLDNLATIDDFFNDCAAGTLPAVSFVDPEAGIASELGKTIQSIPPIKWLLETVGLRLDTIGGSEEDPQDMSYGEKWAYKVIDAILKSPAWPRTLLIYTYDEHGGYYDHVAPPPAIQPDGIQPKLGPGDVPGGYDIYGPRVPAVVVSPYSKPTSVSREIYDHTSVLATIEAKWNLPALTFRDANANTVMDCLDPANAALMNPPVIESP